MDIGHFQWCWCLVAFCAVYPYETDLISICTLKDKYVLLNYSNGVFGIDGS